MRYSPQQRKAFGEAVNYLNSRDALRLVVSSGASASHHRAGRFTAIPTKRSGNAFETGIVPVARPSSCVSRRKRRAARSGSDGNYCEMPQGMRGGFSFLAIVLALGFVSIWLAIWAMSKMSSILLGKMRRPQYYPQERSRRERLAKERRRVRDRFTTAPCPEPEQLLAQYAKAKTGAREALVFGSMLCDLEAYCDNSLIRNVDGEITGRNPGMKGWIRDNCPKLLAHYKNAMRYKGLAEKFRQVTGAADPVPVAALAAGDDEEVKRLLEGKLVRKITVRMKKSNGPRGGRTVSGTYALNAEALEAARKTAREILDECEEKNKPRLLCGKTLRKNGKGKDDKVEDDARLRCGKKAKGDGEEWDVARLRSEKNRGGVTRLERILDERLDGVPAADLSLAKWRIEEPSAQTGETAECKSA